MLRPGSSSWKYCSCPWRIAMRISQMGSTHHHARKLCRCNGGWAASLWDALFSYMLTRVKMLVLNLTKLGRQMFSEVEHILVFQSWLDGHCGTQENIQGKPFISLGLLKENEHKLHLLTNTCSLVTFIKGFAFSMNSLLAITQRSSYFFSWQNGSLQFQRIWGPRLEYSGIDLVWGGGVSTTHSQIERNLIFPTTWWGLD